jgi:hypothetical protein
MQLRRPVGLHVALGDHMRGDEYSFAIAEPHRFRISRAAQLDGKRSGQENGCQNQSAREHHPALD